MQVMTVSVCGFMSLSSPLDALWSSHFGDGRLLLLMVVVVAARIGDVHEGVHVGESEQSPSFQC
jgi:hypothetical protein